MRCHICDTNVMSCQGSQCRAEVLDSMNSLMAVKYECRLGLISVTRWRYFNSKHT